MASQSITSTARPILVRAFLVLVLPLIILLPTLAEAKGLPSRRDYAGIVVDAKSGKVLYESAADAIRYPASVTKVMTLYILFQELAAGNLTLSTKMRVSKHAASAEPTKLGIAAGSTISVEDAIKAIVTISANDIARVIAEHISGSEAAFAQRMTATAKALGMTRTHYNNASGLPDAGQTTTVRDQSILAIAIYQHFPKYYEYFQTRTFKWGKRTYGNHNRLLGNNGVDGIKTGYINASGFNLMTAARADGHHIVVVGFGFNTSGARDAKIRELVKTYLPKSRTGTYVAQIPVPGRKGAKVQVASAPAEPVQPAPFPSFRGEPDVIATGTVALAATAPAPEPTPLPMPVPAPVTEVAAVSAPIPAVRPGNPMDIGIPPQQALAAVNALGDASIPPQPKGKPVDVVGAWSSDSYELGAAPAPLGQTRPSAPLIPPVDVGGGKPVDPMTSGSIGPKAEQTAAAAPRGATGWVVQIGAAPTEAGATGLLTDAAARIDALVDFRSYVERFEKNGQVFYRARFAGFGGRDDAANMCDALKKANMSCLAMQG